MFFTVIKYSPTVNPEKIPLELEGIVVPTKLPEIALSENSKLDGVPPMPETETSIVSFATQLIGLIGVTLIVSKI